jgi:AAA15 family ATPase/GTPase
MEHKTRITAVHFRNYRGLRDFILTLEQMNVLVGPNNCGKSTILGAFRILAAGMAKARHSKAEKAVCARKQLLCYRVPPGPRWRFGLV